MYANVQGFAAKIRVRCLGLVRLLMLCCVLFSFVLEHNVDFLGPAKPLVHSG